MCCYLILAISEIRIGQMKGNRLHFFPSLGKAIFSLITVTESSRKRVIELTTANSRAKRNRFPLSHSAYPLSFVG